MTLREGCPRCSTPVGDDGRGGWSCPEHGSVRPLWRVEEASYDGFGEHLRAAAGFPTYLPWPMSPGWRVSDFASVGVPGRDAVASMTCVSGTSALDGPVDVFVVTEEPGVGLGARVAGLARDDPGAEIAQARPEVKVRLDHTQIGLWAVSTSELDEEWDRSVLAGEAGGRWLWMVLRPASAILLLRDSWILRDVSGSGPELVEMPFGGPGTTW